MLTIQDLVNSRKRDRKKPDEEDLRRLPFKQAFIYGRVSSPGQVRDSHESVREIARLVGLAIKDGYKTNLDPGVIEDSLILLWKDNSGQKVWSDGEVTIDVRDLGISGQLCVEDRKGLEEFLRRLKEGTVGAVYLTEGVSRLSRDKDKILPYQLLKLLKEQECRIRTPEGVWNPAIERDSEYLAEEFEDAIGESKVMNRRMFRRKSQKACRGEYVGEPVPPGFILPVTGRKPTGEYEYGKIEPYPPHSEIVKRVIEEYINHSGSPLKTVKALNGLVFPCFPPDLQYMERLTSLRVCLRTELGYKITSYIIRGLASNLKMIGIWQWGDNDPIVDNHASAVPQDLFLQAWQLANNPKKPKGRAINYEPLEWSGLLRCMNHPEPCRIVSQNSKGRYVCQRDFMQGGPSICMDITARFLNEPLTAEVLSQLDFTPFTEEILARMESEQGQPKVEEKQARQQARKFEEDIRKWQSLLPCCVDSATGQVDREKEDYYWVKIRETSQKLEAIKTRPVPRNTTAIDFNQVRNFLKDLPNNWRNYSLTSRNQLLKLMIEAVELRGSRDIEATIIWKMGFRQKVIIHRPKSNSKLECRWTKEEDEQLKMLFPSSPEDVVKAAITNRTWKAIELRAFRLGISREKKTKRQRRRWTAEEDAQIKEYCSTGLSYEDISNRMNVPVDLITQRVRNKHFNTSRPPGKQIKWESSGLLPSQEASSRENTRG